MEVVKRRRVIKRVSRPGEEDANDPDQTVLHGLSRAERGLGKGLPRGILEGNSEQIISTTEVQSF